MVGLPKKAYEQGLHIDVPNHLIDEDWHKIEHSLCKCWMFFLFIFALVVALIVLGFPGFYPNSNYIHSFVKVKADDAHANSVATDTSGKVDKNANKGGSGTSTGG